MHYALVQLSDTLLTGITSVLVHNFCRAHHHAYYPAPLIPDNSGADGVTIERSSVPDPALPQLQPILGIATGDKGHAPWGIGCSSSLTTFWDPGFRCPYH